MKRYVPFLLLGVVAAVLYGHTMQVPLYLDDGFSIAQNPKVLELRQAFAGLFDRRGLSTLSFALNYVLGGQNLVGYHLVNTVVHLVSAILVLLLLRRIFPRRADLPLFGALLFLVHPLQTQAVTYLVQRMTSLSAMFFLLGLYLYLRARERRALCDTVDDREHRLWYGGALLASGLAILSKENAVIFPVALVLVSRLLLPRDGEPWRALLRYTIPYWILPGVAVVSYVVWPTVFGAGLDPGGTSALLSNMQGNSPLNYLVTQFSVLWIYIRMLFLPYGQALDHAYPVSRELLTLQSVTGGVGLLGLLALAWRIRRRQPKIAFAIGWFFMALVIESSLIPLDPLFEHRLYLPMFGFAVLVTAGLEMIPRDTLRYAGGVVVLVLLALLTWQRNALWNDPIALYEDNLRVAPHNERVMFNLGELYRKYGNNEQAERLLVAGVERNPRVDVLYLALKELYSSQGRVDDLIDMLHYAIDHLPNKGNFYNDLAFAYARKGDLDNAIAMLQQSISINPKVATSHVNLAQMYFFKRNPVLGERHLRQALAIDPKNDEARRMLEELHSGAAQVPAGSRP